MLPVDQNYTTHLRGHDVRVSFSSDHKSDIRAFYLDLKVGESRNLRMHVHSP